MKYMRILLLLFFSLLIFQNCDKNTLKSKNTDNRDILWEKMTFSTGDKPSQGSVHIYKDSQNHLYFYANCRIFKSEDNGKTIQKLNTNDEDYKLLYIDKDDKIYCWVYMENVIKISDDDGETWTTKKIPGSERTHSFFINSKGHMFARQSVRYDLYNVIGSYDGGSTWEKLIEKEEIQGGKFYLDNDDVLYYWQEDTLSVSTDDGKSWNKTFDNLGRILTLKKTSGKILLSTSNGLYSSLDEGKNWELINSEYKSISKIFIGNEDQIFLYNSPKVYRFNLNSKEINEVFSGDISNMINYDSFIFIGTYYEGMYISSDNGESWNNICLNPPQIPGLLFTKKKRLIIPLFYSDDIGNNWNKLQTEFGSDSKNDFAEDSKGNIFGVVPFGIEKSEDGGLTYKKTNIKSGPQSSSILIDENDNIYASYSHDGVFKSSDEGENWIQILQDTDSWQNCLYSSNDKIYVGTSAGLFRTSNSGDNWAKILEGNILGIAVNSEEEIFVCLRGRGSILLSIDNGENWETINDEIGGEILIDNQDRILIGSLGIHISDDNGVTFNKTEFQDQVLSLKFYPEDKLYFVGTYDSGLIRGSF